MSSAPISATQASPAQSRRALLRAQTPQRGVVAGGETLGQGLQVGRLTLPVIGDLFIGDQAAEEEIQFQIGGAAKGGMPRRPPFGAEMVGAAPAVGDEGFRQCAQGILRLGVAIAVAEPAPVRRQDVRDAVRGAADLHRGRRRAAEDSEQNGRQEREKARGTGTHRQTRPP